MKINGKALVISIVIPLATGGLSALLTGGGMTRFAQVNKPPLSPPGWLFPVVWTILYILMGIAAYLVYVADEDAESKAKALSVYGYQLVVNFLWPVFFFDFGWYLFSFFWLLLLWVLVVQTIRLFSQISETAGYLLIPYLIWLSFAAYLNLGIWYLNR